MSGSGAAGRRGSRAGRYVATPFLVAGLLLTFATSPATAEGYPRSVPAGSAAVELVRNFWDLVASQQGTARQDRPPSQPIPPAAEGTPPVDLSDLSNPVEIENRLKTALAPKDAAMRVTVPGGTARRGSFIVGSAETLEGNLLVVQGDADVYGRLNGNLVTVEGDVIVHPGALVSGDVLALGGEVRDM